MCLSGEEEVDKHPSLGKAEGIGRWPGDNKLQLFPKFFPHKDHPGLLSVSCFLFFKGNIAYGSVDSVLL